MILAKKRSAFSRVTKKRARFDLNNDILKQKDFFMHFVSYSAERYTYMTDLITALIRNTVKM